MATARQHGWTEAIAPSFRPKQAAEFLGIGESTLWRYTQRPDFPRPMRLSARCTVFASDQLIAWRDAQANCKGA